MSHGGPAARARTDDGDADEEDREEEAARRSNSRTPPPTVSASAKRDGVRVAVAAPAPGVWGTSPVRDDASLEKTSSVHINGDHVTHVRVDASVLATPPPEAAPASPALSRRSSARPRPETVAVDEPPGPEERSDTPPPPLPEPDDADEEDRDQGELLVTTRLAVSQVAAAPNKGDAGSERDT